MRWAAGALLIASLGCAGSGGSGGDGHPQGTGGSGGSGGDGIDFGGGAGDPNDPDADGYDAASDCDPLNESINPGALELDDDAIDNDCDGQTDEAAVICDGGFALDTADAMDLARSLGLCDTAVAGAQGADRRWGVLEAAIETSDGAGAPLARQHGVQSAWGGTIVPRAHASMVALSTGVARTPGQPAYVALPKGTDASTNVNAPPAGFPKNAAGCPVSQNPAANDSIVLRLTIRVPTNVNALSFDFKFYTAEYIEYVCQAYNDSFIALLDTQYPLDPLHDGNVSFGENGDPINVNSAFFQACVPDSWLGQTFTCPLGTDELAGTGYDAIAPTLTTPAQNGATDWLTTSAPVIPGEEITLRFMIWNAGDHWLQSTVLLDNWQWSPTPIDGPVTEPPH